MGSGEFELLIEDANGMDNDRGDNEQSVHVRDFGALPNDGKDDSEAIRKAIDYAKDNGTNTVVLEAGVYDLKDGHSVAIDSYGEAHIHIHNAHDFTLRGAVDAKGFPTTMLLRENPATPMDLRSILLVSNSTDVRVENIAMDNAPVFYSAGEVLEASAERITVRILDGHPIVEGMRTCIMGTYDLKGRKLIKSRLTYNGSAGWTIVDKEKRIMELDVAAMPNYYDRKKILLFAREGVGLYWFFIAASHRPQLGMYTSTDVTLKNIHAANASGFAYQALACRNITIDNVSLEPTGNRIAGCPRDGFKMNSCSGTVDINELTIDGCNDDAMNIHSTPFKVRSVLSPSRIVVRIQNSHGWMWKYLKGVPIAPGEGVTVIELSSGKRVYDGKIKSAEAVKGGMLLTLAEPVGEEVVKGMVVTIHAYTISQFNIRNSTFRNVSGNAIVFANQNATIEDCVFEDVNGKAVIAGCALHPPYYDKYEVTIPDEVIVRNSRFKNCNIYPEWHLGKPKGVISVSNGRLVSERTIGNVEIVGNTFEEIAENTSAVYIEHLVKGRIEGNTYPAGSVFSENLTGDTVNISIKDNRAE
jgi:hypothetical protein